MERTDPNIVLMLGRCWTTSTPSPLSLPQWDLLIDGCPYQDDRYLTTLVPVTGSSGLQFPTHYKRFVCEDVHICRSSLTGCSAGNRLHPLQYRGVPSIIWLFVSKAAPGNEETPVSRLSSGEQTVVSSGRSYSGHVNLVFLINPAEPRGISLSIVLVRQNPGLRASSSCFFLAPLNQGIPFSILQLLTWAAQGST
ncbi:zona pellucida sperm-binding protein 1-like [Carassius auratus]|uniref:Zona pellucida sperm-binding protein 1-like n=1 Tax=Carassius auratus TaxID=7957 RepID=A0A6P6M5K9_CARAU|nr:zona pellucida sperm-binding protein 1-like [Carassius auratus]